MPRQANGTYLPPANTTAVTATTISSTAYNTLETDIGTEITNSVDRGGRSAMTAALPMGSNKITGMAEPTVSTDAATKNYVDTTTAAFFSTGDVKMTIKTVADTGWLLFDDTTFGSASSGASNRTNADTQSLFTLFFNNLSDTAAPILTSGGGATTRAAQVSASAAWAANCRMSLPKTLGRAMAVAGTGSGLTARALGAIAGAESVAIAQSGLPNVSPVFTGTPSGTGTSDFMKGGNQSGVVQSGAGQNNVLIGTTPAQVVITPLGSNSSINGGVAQTTTPTLPPEVFLNAMIKL